MKAPEPTIIDFETKAIKARPHYPPIPVGVTILPPGHKPIYYAWGHPTKNNTTKQNAARILRRVWREDVLCFQNGMFDYDVGTTHLDMPEKDWDDLHDTLYLMFLNDPHAVSLQLKVQAEKLLGIVPKERDRLRDWILANIPGAKKKDWGAYIADAPGDIVAGYSAQGDGVMTQRIFKHLWPRIVKAGMQKAYDRERELMPILLTNAREGMRVDLRKLERELPQYEAALKTVEHWLCRYLKVKELNFDTPADVAAALLKQPRSVNDKKNWERTPKTGAYSTKKEVLDEVVKDKRLRLAMKYRGKLETYLSMFLRQWVETARETGGTIHPAWNQVRQAKNSGGGKGTRTGRPSTGDGSTNFLNIPKNIEESDPTYHHPAFVRNLPELPNPRIYVLPDKGHRWIHRDYDQQELRILAHYENGRLREAYAKDPELDVHDWVKDEIKRTSGLTMIRRDVKIINFGIIYGMGVGKLARKLGRDVKSAMELKSAHRIALPGVKDLEKEIKELARAGKPIRTWGGRLYYVEEPRLIWNEETQENHEQTYEYKLLNYLIQGSAADCTKQSIIDHSKIKRHGRFLITVYDENNISAPKKAWKRENELLRQAMEAQKFDVPMLSDGKSGRAWGYVR